MKYHKYHALGNDYLVIDPADAGPEITTAQVRLLCHRHYGLGSDGILFGPLPDGVTGLVADGADLAADRTGFALRIYNPDGGEAEKSGNGLRIFARYLWDTGRVRTDPFHVHTLGGTVTCSVLDGGHTVRVDMGRASFSSGDIPVVGPPREVINETIDVGGGRRVTFCAVTVGNPHCVVPRDAVSELETVRLGPTLETAGIFPNRTNVQFMQVVDRHNIRIEIWERGAGRTLASGSSAAAAAAVAVRLGMCATPITVHMAGGTLAIELTPGYEITLTGPVTGVAHGELDPDLGYQEAAACSR